MAALAIKHWAKYWQNKKVYLYSDNKCTVSIINKCACRNRQIMDLLRDNFWLAAKFNIHVKAIYLPGSLNTLSDTVSRLHEGIGQLQFLESLINEWYFCHWGINNYFSSVSLANHMSLLSIVTLQCIITEWRKQKMGWMPWFSHSSQPPWQNQLKSHTGVRYKPASHTKLLGTLPTCHSDYVSNCIPYYGKGCSLKVTFLADK